MFRFATIAVYCLGLAIIPTGDRVQAQTLAEIDVDNQGAVTEVRDEAGIAHAQQPFSEATNFDLIESKPLHVQRVEGQIEGQAAACCRRGGVWRTCLDGLAGTITVDYKGLVVEPEGHTEVPINAATVKATKSHVLLVVEDGNGERHALVVAEGTLHAPDHLLPK